MATDIRHDHEKARLEPAATDSPVVELERLRCELAAKTARLLELEDFAHCVAHDLKEPLRAVTNYARFVREDFAAELPEEGHANLLVVEKHARLMKERIDALIELTRATETDHALEDVDLPGLIEEILQSLQGLIDESSAEVTVSDGVSSLHCNRTRVRQVFENLIANGIKYNQSAHKTVRIGTVSGASPATLFVADNGIGIPAEQQAAVFRVFRRLHDRAAYGGGTGMGLTIAQRLVARHGGRIWLTSSPGNGTTVFFTLEPGVDASPTSVGRPDLDAAPGRAPRGAPAERGDGRA